MIYLVSGMHEDLPSQNLLAAQRISEGQAPLLRPSSLPHHPLHHHHAQHDKWRATLVFFTLARQTFSTRDDVRLCLFTDVMPPPVIDGLDLATHLPALGVEIIPRAHYWRPVNPSPRSADRFYLFDMCEACLDFAGDDDHILVADSACLFVGSGDAIIDRLTRDNYLLARAAAPSDRHGSSLTRPEDAALYGVLGGIREPLVAPDFDPAFFGIAVDDLGRFLDRAGDALEANDRRQQSELPHFSAAAQFFNYVMVQLGRTEANADDLMRCIPTSWAEYETQPADGALAIWLLPHEREFGLPALAQYIIAKELIARQSVGQTDAPVSNMLTRDRLAHRFGIGRKRRIALALRLMRFRLVRIVQRVSDLFR